MNINKLRETSQARLCLFRQTYSSSIEKEMGIISENFEKFASIGSYRMVRKFAPVGYEEESEELFSIKMFECIRLKLQALGFKVSILTIAEDVTALISWEI